MGAPSTQEPPEPPADVPEDLKKPAAAAAENHSLGSASGAAPATTLQTYLNLVQQYLGVLEVENAIFLAERCVADYPSNTQAAYLLALCHHRRGAPHAARQVLQHTRAAPPTPAMEYLHALCCLELNDLASAEDILLRKCRALHRRVDVGNLDDWILQTTPCPIPNGATGLALMGKICRRMHRKERAIDYFRMSLKLDPFLWTSAAALAELGVQYDPAEFFGMEVENQRPPQAPAQPHPAQHHANHASASSSLLQAKTPLQPSTAVETPAPPTSALPTRRSVRFETPNLTPIPVNASMAETPAHNPVATDNQHQQMLHHSTIDYPHPPVPLRRAARVASRQYYPPSPDTPLTAVTKSMRYLRGLGEDEAASSFIHGADDSSACISGRRNLFLSSSENKASNNARTAADPNNTSETEKPPVVEKNAASHAKVQEILQVLSIASLAYQHLCNYRCPEALSALDMLSHKQQETGWVLHQRGKALMEMNDFTAAQRSLESMQVKDPSRVQGLELLSTVYWQLKKEMELANLAHTVVEHARLTPEAWCVVGNCFSLQKDHETALVFFKRSLQLDPNFAYTHTLSGYEYMANEDFDKAIKCFREAMRVDDCRYNAWYGLGAIYYRQEKYDLAEHHFAKAVALHPKSSVLLCNLGMAQYANRQIYKALDTLKEANRLDPRNPQARFQRATIFMSISRLTDALDELEKVRDAAPREATVHFAMGKVLKRLNRPQQAMKCFLTAMDLDPKDNQLIKSAMDKLHEQDMDEEQMHAF